MNYKLRTKDGFTLIELVVAIALLAMVISFTSVIFKVSIESYRIAAANAEIMQKLRAITDQLNSDFKGIRKDAPFLIWFELGTSADQRFDQIMFFANGDFQSTQLYDGIVPNTPPFFPASTGRPVIGNAARIHYGQAQVSWTYPGRQQSDERILARRRHILTADADLDLWPDPNLMIMKTTFADFYTYPDGYGAYKNEIYEHDALSLSQWKSISTPSYWKHATYGITARCVYHRPEIDLSRPRTFHKLMCEGVGSLKIQWSYHFSTPVPPIFTECRWWPSVDPDPDNDPLINDSDFDLMPRSAPGAGAFGIYFNLPDSVTSSSGWYWNEPEEALYWIVPGVTNDNFGSDFFPAALKFTFTLYDSRGVIKDGRTFTHIIYLGE